MKSLLYFVASCALFIVSCNKDKQPAPQPDPIEPQGKWLRYTTANSGIADNQVNAIAIATGDIKWIGTSRGLNRFDGTHWSAINPGNSPLPSYTITALAVQADGAVWIGTDKGLALFDGMSWEVFNSANSMLPVDAVISIHHDTRRGITWVGTAQGLVEIDAGGEWIYHDGFSDELILSMATDDDGALWLGTFDHFNFRGCIVKFLNGQYTVYKLADMGYESTFVYGIGIDGFNKPVAALSGTSVRSVLLFEDDNWKELDAPADADGVRALVIEQDKVWVGGYRLSTYGKNAGSVVLPGTDAFILTMAIDNKGNKWIGTSGGGLLMFAG